MPKPIHHKKKATIKNQFSGGNQWNNDEGQSGDQTGGGVSGAPPSE
jgi:hypothetical protein